MKILRRLQRDIERLHAINTDLDVSAYVVGDSLRASIPGARAELPEQFFVYEEDDALELALYICPSIVARLERDDPRRRLHDGNLEQFCIALEGVSHFVFVAWRAQVGRPVSVLELEIQAEVDKFATAWLLLGRQGARAPRQARPLLRQLFERYELRAALQSHEARRYHLANEVARRYCTRLAERYGADHTDQRFTRDVRAFFRTGLAEKLRVA